MRRHAKATSAGSTAGTANSRTRLRRASATRAASLGSNGSGAPSRRSLALIAAAALLVFMALAPLAQAAPKSVIATFGQGSLERSSGIAVNATGAGAAEPGEVYVLDNGHSQVQRFDADGNFIAAFGSAGTQGGQFAFTEPTQIAVDQSDGSLYVADSANNRIQKFSADGTFIYAAGLDVDAGGGSGVELCSVEAECQAATAGSGDGELSAPQGIAVDPSDGSVFVADTANTRIETFSSAGAYLSQFGSAELFLSGPVDVAVDSSGSSYVLSPFEPVRRYDPSGAFVAAISNVALEGQTLAELAVDSSNDHVLVGQLKFDFGVFGFLLVKVVELDSDGTLIESHGTGTGLGASAGVPAVSGLAANGASGRLYVGGNDLATNESKVAILDLKAPDATTQPASGLSSTAALLNAKLNSNGLPTTYHFEYGTVDCSIGPCTSTPDQSAGSGAEPLLRSRQISGLSPDTTYHYRVLATNSVGTTVGSDRTFRTLASPLDAPDACPNAAIRAAQGAANVGDCRAYEMVSPVQKNGGDVIGDPEHTRAAADGAAVQFSSRLGFANTLGAGLIFEYMALRTPEGWKTHSLMPPQEPQHGSNTTISMVPMYQGDFSDDLSTGVFRALSPLSDDPNVANTRNLYLRRDLRSPGLGTYDLLTPTEVPLPPFGTSPNDTSYSPVFAESSADFRHVIFESTLNLTAQASGKEPKLYEWFDGTVRLAGVLPDGKPAMCPDEGSGEQVCSSAGRGASGGNYTEATISRDGSRIFFSSPVDYQGAWTPQTQLYMRLNGTSTARVSASERAEPDLERGAEFAGASADGRYVFFLSSERLTDDDIDDDSSSGYTGQDLYRYDTSLPDSDPHNLTLVARTQAGSQVEGVLGVSDDGDYVYFAAPSGQGAVNEPAELPDSNFRGLYVLHDGQLRVIGFVRDDDVKLMLALGGFGLNVRKSRVTPDGRALAFIASDGTGLTGYDHGECVPDELPPGCFEAYVYDATANGGEGELSCASCNPSGTTASANAAIDASIGTAFLPRSTHLSHALSDDGRWVFFTSRERLLPEDRNGNVRDVYEYDVPSHTLHLLSTGTSPSDSYFIDASDSGEDVFFITRERLVGADIDRAYDLYDARVGGGFPEPPPRQVCEGDSCLISPSAPNDPTPASSAFNGAGNANPARAKGRCAKGSKRVKRKGKARCVKPRKNRAENNRRTSR